METIKNYLEGMFASLPNTPEVLKAKHELYQMMEDKYNELISEGRNDNEAVGVVISEFGNLDDLAEDLGIKNVTEEYKCEECRFVGKDEALSYIDAKRSHSIKLSLGIFFCIISVIGPILSDACRLPAAFGASSFFVLIAIGVMLIVYSNMIIGKWRYLFEEPSALDYSTALFLKGERDKFTSPHALRLTAGIILCVICWLPTVITSEMNHVSVFLEESVAPAFLFVMVGVGVFLIVQSNIEMGAYEKLLKLDGKAHHINTNRKDVPDYSNPTLDIIMHVYWPTMTCIYLVWSFLTFDWWITWIIWPISGVIFGALKTIFRNEEK